MKGVVYVKTVRVVIGCTNRKTRPALTDLEMHKYHNHPFKEKATLWNTRLAHSTTDTIPAAELYKGEHWSVVKQMLNIKETNGINYEIWIASAGYGLIRSTHLVEPYAATFSPGSKDFVLSDKATNAGHTTQDWWELLANRPRRKKEPASLEDLATSNPSDFLVVALSETYARAVHDDLIKAAKTSNNQLVLISAGSSISSLTHVQSPSDARLQSLLGGSRISLNARIVLHLIQNSSKHEWSKKGIDNFLQQALAKAPELVKYNRSKMTSEEVISFIKKHQDTHPSHTALLRLLRDSGMACEQTRFRDLYYSVHKGKQ